MEQEQFSELIGSIYDCAVDPGLWPTALEGICLAVDSAAATLAVADFVTGEERAVVNVGIADEYLASYRDRYHCTDLFLHSLMLQDVDQPARSADMVSDEELLQSKIYREWAAPQGFRDTLMTPLIKHRARLGFIGLTRRHDQRRYDENDKTLMGLLAPHVRRAVTIADLIGHKESETASSASSTPCRRRPSSSTGRAGLSMRTHRVTPSSGRAPRSCCAWVWSR